MMKILYYLLLSISVFSVNAQTLSLNPSHIEANLENEDLSDNFIQFLFKTYISNETANSLNIKWLRKIGENCPEEWQVFTSDKNNDYTPLIFSNIDPALNIFAPIELLPLEMDSYYAIHVSPKGVAGCCQYSVDFSTVEEPDVILTTATFDIRINDPNCSTTDIKEPISLSNIQVFPNPTTNYFELKNALNVETVKLFDARGQYLKSLTNSQTGEYFIGDLESGVYFLAIESKRENNRGFYKLMKL